MSKTNHHIFLGKSASGKSNAIRSFLLGENYQTWDGKLPNAKNNPLTFKALNQSKFIWILNADTDVIVNALKRMDEFPGVSFVFESRSAINKICSLLKQNYSIGLFYCYGQHNQFFVDSLDIDLG